jgi:hypothetical protein
VCVVADGRDNEVRAVCCDHGGLRKPRAWVVFLYDGVHAHDCDDNAQGEVERDEEAVEGAGGTGEEAVEHARERDGEDIHECGGPD